MYVYIEHIIVSFIHSYHGSDGMLFNRAQTLLNLIVNKYMGKSGKVNISK